MEAETSDSYESEKSNIKNVSTLLVIGIFLYLSITAFSYSIELLLRDALVNADCAPLFIFWTVEISMLIIVFILTLLFVKSINLKELGSGRKSGLTLRNVILFFIVTQILQAIYPFAQLNIWPEDIISRVISYYDATRGVLELGIAESLFVYLKYVIIGVVIWKHKEELL